jgi:hydrogenase/urease accessory protein HupE
MGTNLPTILPMLRFWIIILACVLTSITAQAHPGHEGGHDGDEFVWTADHLARHPGATLMIVAVVALIAWGAFRFFSSSQRQLKAAAARSPVAGKTV